MRRMLPALVCAAALLPGCGNDSPSVTADTSASPSAQAPDRVSRDAQIYAAVIRTLVLGANGVAADKTPYKRIWVVDHELLGAGLPDAANPPGDTFGDALKAELKQVLADLPPLAFVSDPDEVIVHDETAAAPLRDHIRGHGTVILLAPIEAHGDRVHVGHEAWCAAHCAEWFTSVVREEDGTWTVTGETGPHAIT